jgi:hypothetical protein
MTTKTLKLISVLSIATTYTFRMSEGFGWALCTINDETGELIITSDWGSWSYLWSPKPDHLGAATLTHFIGDRGSVDYLVNKLLGRRACQQFSVDATVRHLRTLIAKRRLADGQEINLRRRECGDEREGFLEMDYHDRYYLTAGQARDLWDEVQSIGSDLDGSSMGEQAATLYVERLMQIDNIERISEEPYEELQHVESHESKVLTQVILPALVAACHAHTEADPHYVKLREEFLAARAAKAKASVEALVSLSGGLPA